MSANTQLLGRRVRVKLDENLIQEGKLLGFGEDGEINILGDDGMVWHGWPALEVTEAPEPDNTLPRRDGHGMFDLTCGACGETFGTNCRDDDITCPECGAHRCPHCGGWFGED